MPFFHIENIGVKFISTKYDSCPIVNKIWTKEIYATGEIYLR